MNPVEKPSFFEKYIHPHLGEGEDSESDKGAYSQYKACIKSLDHGFKAFHPWRSLVILSMVIWISGLLSYLETDSYVHFVPFFMVFVLLFIFRITVNEKTSQYRIERVKILSLEDQAYFSLQYKLDKYFFQWSYVVMLSVFACGLICIQLMSFWVDSLSLRFLCFLTLLGAVVFYRFRYPYNLIKEIKNLAKSVRG